jgi:hypothetical protein
LTYTITITGTADNEESERTNLENAREFALSLEGLTSGSFNGEHVGNNDLTGAPEEGEEVPTDE